MTKRKLEIDLRFIDKFPDLNCFTFGLDNSHWNNRFGIQYYDYDGQINKSIIEKVLEIFPNDCIAYKSPHGTHFLSFTLIKYQKTLDNVDYLNETYFPEQDYHVRYNLTLRIAPKFDILTGKIVSAQPTFLSLLKEPQNLKNQMYSYYALIYYYNHLGLPFPILDKYNEELTKKWLCKFHVYRTKANTKEV